MIAVDAAGNLSTPSSALPVAWSSSGADVDAPSAPVAKVLSVTSSTINLSWSAASDNVGVTGYRVYRGNTLVATTTQARFLDRGLNAKTRYTYRVVAVDAAGNTTASEAVAVTTKAASRSRSTRH